MSTVMDARSRMSVLGAVVMSSMAKQVSAATDNNQESALRTLYDATGGASWTNKVRVLKLSHSSIPTANARTCQFQLKRKTPTTIITAANAAAAAAAAAAANITTHTHRLGSVSTTAHHDAPRTAGAALRTRVATRAMMDGMV